jgi:hypothetical protein
MPLLTAFASLSVVGIRKKIAAVVVEGPVTGFGPVATNFINTFSGTKKYIDITNGSDSNNGDTDAAAYQTLAYAQAQTAAIGTAVMYVIKPGVYTLTPVVVQATFNSAGFSDGNLPRTFFCAAGQVVFQWTATSTQRDATMVDLQNTNSSVYGAILKRNNNGKTTSYSTAMLNGSTSTSKGDFYNCVFQETNANGDWSLQYDNPGAIQTTVNNCSFYTTENGQADYSGGAGLVLNNCAFRYVWGTSNSTRNSTISAQTMDATTYELATNNSTHGVYSGTYAWGTDMWGLQTPSVSSVVEYLVIAGGGGGGEGYYGSGGGAGGFRTASGFTVSAGPKNVTVGAGGAGATSQNSLGGGGGNSVFSSIMSIGGGGGASRSYALAGGSGGSGGGTNYLGPNSGGQGTSGQGNDGGAGGSGQYGSGGGGAASAGSAGGADGSPAGLGTVGGAALASSISGTLTYYAGGGGGGNIVNATQPQPNGQGGGGVGGTTTGGNGTTNTGGGGGGGGGNHDDGGAGGSGVVILKYPDTLTLTIDAGLTSTTDSSTVAGYKITTFTAGTGNVTF